VSTQGIPTPQWAPVGGTWSVGLDVGGTKVLGVLLDAEGVVRHQLRAATVGGAAGVVDSVVAVVTVMPSRSSRASRASRSVVASTCQRSPAVARRSASSSQTAMSSVLGCSRAAFA
jgi:hypothetical protein